MPSAAYRCLPAIALLLLVPVRVSAVQPAETTAGDAAEATETTDMDEPAAEAATADQPESTTPSVRETDEITMGMNAGNKPAVIRSGSDFLYVLMPVDLG